MEKGAENVFSNEPSRNYNHKHIPFERQALLLSQLFKRRIVFQQGGEEVA